MILNVQEMLAIIIINLFSLKMPMKHIQKMGRHQERLGSKTHSKVYAAGTA